MNPHPCRRHLWLGADAACVLCGALDQHKHCYSDWHACAWYEPLEWDAPRREAR